MNKARLEQMSRFYLVDDLNDEHDKAYYNSIQRIQELMCLETDHIDKQEHSRQAGIKKSQRKIDLDLEKKTLDEIYKESLLVMGRPEVKGVVLNTLVNSQLKNEDAIYYKTRIYENVPKFVYLPRGREIFQRLVIRAALCNSIDELRTQREFDEEKKKEMKEL